jgi:hypothetical protein
MRLLASTANCGSLFQSCGLSRPWFSLQILETNSGEVVLVNIDALLNDFAIRSFRDMGDFDYISARMSHKGRLYPQYLWSGLQAVEKYFKCILLLNRIPAQHVRHDLDAGLRLLERKAPFQMLITAHARGYINRLNTYGQYRYLEAPFLVNGNEVASLDKTVWEIRRYCTVLNYEMDLPNGTKQNILSERLKHIERSANRPPQEFRLAGGKLEEILANKRHPARPQLLWQNLYFGSRTRSTVKLSRSFHATNSPLSLHPEILDEVVRYVFLPKDVVKTYRAEIKRQ